MDSGVVAVSADDPGVSSQEIKLRGTGILEVSCLHSEPALVMGRGNVGAANIPNHFLGLQLNERQRLPIVGRDEVHLP